MTLAQCEVSRQAILADPDWLDGNYYGGPAPVRGLAVARMAAHLTYISGEYLDAKYGSDTTSQTCEDYRSPGDFEVQRQLRYEGERFVARFDANSYLALLRAIEHFDLTAKFGSLPAAFDRVRSRVLLISFSTDWLFPKAQLDELETALRQVGADVAHTTIETPFGHDAFLTDWQKLAPVVAAFLAE
jgi:homoserine O-acetyltransferase